MLADGSSVDVDAIVAATGFRTGLKPLVGHLGVLDNHAEPVVHRPDEHPEAAGLNFVGFRLTLGGTFRLVGGQAQELARAVGSGPRQCDRTWISTRRSYMR